MKVVWTKGLKTEEEKEKRAQALLNAKEVLDILYGILEDKELNALRAAKPDFIDSGWPYRAADINGYLRAVQEIKKIIPQE